MKLAGSRVLLTGASGGIGIEILQLLLEQDACVVAVSKENGLIHAQLGELAHDRRELLLIEGDLTDAAFRAVVG